MRFNEMFCLTHDIIMPATAAGQLKRPLLAHHKRFYKDGFCELVRKQADLAKSGHDVFLVVANSASSTELQDVEHLHAKSAASEQSQHQLRA